MKEERGWEVKEREVRQREKESGKRFSGDGGTSFDPVCSTWVLQVRRSLGSDHSLNTPRRTCRGIIHCLYFLLLSSPSPSAISLLFFTQSPVLSISVHLLSSPLFSFLTCEEPSATRCKRAIIFLGPLACFPISRYRNSFVYFFFFLSYGVNLSTPLELLIMSYFWRTNFFGMKWTFYDFLLTTSHVRTLYFIRQKDL